MIHLIGKDILFNRRAALFGLGLLVIVGLALSLAGPLGVVAALVVAPAILLNQTIGKSCYTDDKDGFALLRALPVSTASIVGAKYLSALVVIGGSMALLQAIFAGAGVLGANLVMPGLDLIAYVAGIQVALYAIYLWLFFRFNFGAAQQSSLLLAVVLVGILKVTEAGGGPAGPLMSGALGVDAGVWLAAAVTAMALSAAVATRAVVRRAF